MNSAPAIVVERVSKKFRLFRRPQDRLWEALHPFGRKFHREFWALRDVDLTVHRGETLGIVGRNGSGKSTLLELICGVLRPTNGSVHVAGRISALLELGAGFNPEFTGRDNVLFQGVRSGLSMAAARARMSAVEEFAEIGEFIDQPIKTYSSGMFVRLAFASAIQVDPDILIVDEALAVGDARFRHKCYQKFHEFQAAGKTILLVTHDAEAVLKHCDRALLLDRGRAVMTGPPPQIIHKYTDILEAESRAAMDGASRQGTPYAVAPTTAPGVNVSPKEAFAAAAPIRDGCRQRAGYNPAEYRQGPSRAEIIDYALASSERFDVAIVKSGEPLEIHFKVRYHARVERPHFGFSLKTVDGVMLFATNTHFERLTLEAAEAGDVVSCVFTVPMNLQRGDYFLDLGADEQTGATSFVNLHRRCSIAHLQVLESRRFNGFIDLQPRFSESRLPRPATRAA